VSTDSTKAMQDALQTAVARMNNGSASEPRVNLMEAVGPLVALLPRLLQNNGGEEVLDRLETLQKGDLTVLREQVQILRKQCYRMLKSQEQLLEKVHEIQRQQVAAAGAVLDLAQQMARITLLDDSSDAGGDDEAEELAVPVMHYRAAPATRKNGHATRHRNR
jgi:uncharacterized protein HemY